VTDTQDEALNLGTLTCSCLTDQVNLFQKCQEIGLKFSSQYIGHSCRVHKSTTLPPLMQTVGKLFTVNFKFGTCPICMRLLLYFTIICIMSSELGHTSFPVLSVVPFCSYHKSIQQCMIMHNHFIVKFQHELNSNPHC
jgi:hypothetical protein